MCVGDGVQRTVAMDVVVMAIMAMLCMCGDSDGGDGSV